MAIDEVDTIDECQNLLNESSNVQINSEPINENFGTRMAADAFYIPKNGKAPLGEDAHFICIEEQTIGVADGVGGWAKWGIDSAEYSREFVINAKLSIHKQREQKNKIEPKKVLNEAYSNTKSQGSSTACILTLTCYIVHAVSVGDSRFVVMRNGIIVYKSEIQQKKFNCPFQLGNSDKSDDPSVAQEIEVPVEIWDVIVMGSDGLFDNVHDFELEALVQEGLIDLYEWENTKMLARKIAEYALKNSKNKLISTPFSEESLKAGKQRLGGKRDDITGIVAHILPL